jgi:hypothetical protein
MKKLLLSISLLTIIISFQSCSKYEDNNGITIASKTIRLCLSEWTATKIVWTNDSLGIYEAAVTRDIDWIVEFNDDQTVEDEVSAGGVTQFGIAKWNWTDGKRTIEIRSDDNGRLKEVWGIDRLEMDSFWVNTRVLETGSEFYIMFTR